MKTLQRNLLLLLEPGFDPYKDNLELEAKFLGTDQEPIDQVPAHPKKDDPAPPHEKTAEKKEKTASHTPSTKGESAPNTPVQMEKSEEKVSVEKAFEIGLKIKRSTLNENSYPKYKSRIIRFQRWLEENGKDTNVILPII